MKKFFALFVSLFIAAVAYAQTSASGSLSAGLTVVSSDPGQLVYLQLSDTSGSANTFIVYDSDSGSTTNRVKPAWYKRTFYTTNEVVSYTNALGRTESVTNVVRASVLALQAASTNEMKRVYTVSVPANSSVVLEPADSLGYTFGYTIKALGTGSYNTSYLPRQ